MVTPTPIAVMPKITDSMVDNPNPVGVNDESCEQILMHRTAQHVALSGVAIWETIAGQGDFADFFQRPGNGFPINGRLIPTDKFTSLKYRIVRR